MTQHNTAVGYTHAGLKKRLTFTVVSLCGIIGNECGFGSTGDRIDVFASWLSCSFSPSGIGGSGFLFDSTANVSISLSKPCFAPSVVLLLFCLVC